jgi:DNA modification methylase
MTTYKLLCGDVLETLKTLDTESVQCVITSPPYYGLRNYKMDGQIGLEQSPQEYIDTLVRIFREMRRVLKSNGVFWLNLGDTYSSFKDGKQVKQTLVNSDKNDIPFSPTRNPAIMSAAGLKNKDLMMLPASVAIALRNDGWYLRSEVVWAKPNPMPESVKDRPTRSHEMIYLFSKSAQYFYDNDAIKEECLWKDNRTGDRLSKRIQKRHVETAPKPHKNMMDDGQQPNSFHKNRANGGKDVYYEMKNKRDVWTVSTSGFKGAHFATFPPKLIVPCVLAGSREGNTILDPFSGSGTTGVVALQNGRNYVGIELNPEYVEISKRRISESLMEI